MSESDQEQTRPSVESAHNEVHATDYPKDGGVGGPILIANEFADVIVTKVPTRNGERLEIWSPRRGSRVRLDAVALDCLSYSPPEFITELLERTPRA